MRRRSSRSSATGRCGSPTSAATCSGRPTSCSRATRAIPLATGILNIWMHDAAEVTAGVGRARRRAHGERFVLGLGASHAPVVDAEQPGPLRGARYSTMVDYLDALDAQPAPLPPARRILAALGPRMLELARDRAAGAHPYLVPPEHTRIARELLGPDRLLAPELSVAARAATRSARSSARAASSPTTCSCPTTSTTSGGSASTSRTSTGPGSDRLVSRARRDRRRRRRSPRASPSTTRPAPTTSRSTSSAPGRRCRASRGARSRRRSCARTSRR